MPSAGSCAVFLSSEFLDLRKFCFSHCPFTTAPHPRGTPSMPSARLGSVHLFSPTRGRSPDCRDGIERARLAEADEAPGTAAGAEAAGGFCLIDEPIFNAALSRAPAFLSAADAAAMSAAICDDVRRTRFLTSRERPISRRRHTPEATALWRRAGVVVGAKTQHYAIFVIKSVRFHDMAYCWAFALPP